MKREIIRLGFSLVGPVVLIIILTMPIGLLTGGLGIIQPVGGIFDIGLGLQEPTEQVITLNGLNAEVTVLVDQWGIPHIYASTAEDAFMALGYLHAKDRLFQMVLQKHLASGRLSEIVGSLAVESDKFYRTIGLPLSAQLTLNWYLEHRDDPEIDYALKIVEAECAGVNAFIRSMTSQNTPIEFKLLGYRPEEWQPVDVFIWAKMMTWSLSGSLIDLLRAQIRDALQNDTLLANLYPDVMPYTIPIVPEQYNLTESKYLRPPGFLTATDSKVITQSFLEPADIPPEITDALFNYMKNVFRPFGAEDLLGSNNWVANGSKTTTGKPILANDPHLGLQAPSLWYEAHIVVPSEGIDVMGVTFPGLPAVVLGHTRTIAWGFTNVGADVLDLFVEKINPENPNQYEYNGKWQDFEIKTENIKVRGGEVVQHTVKWSVHGPLIDSLLDGTPYQNIAMNWTGNSVTHEVLAISRLNRAHNLQDYFDAVFWWDSPPQNIVYADVEGNIAITVAGRFPIRAGYTGEFPVMALNDSVGMVDFIPYAYIPRSVNPSQCYLQSANQRSIDPAAYGYTLLGPYDDGYRGRRIDELLKNSDTISVEDMMRFQADSLEVRAREIVPYVVNAWDNSVEENATVAQAVDWLRDWNYVMDPDLIAPTFWLFLLDAIRELTFDELAPLRQNNVNVQLSRVPVLEKMIKENDPYYFDLRSTDKRETRDNILVQSLHRALDNLASEYGHNTTEWTYGRHHIVRVNHLLGITYIGGGPHRGGDTLNAAHGWVVRSGPSWRMVADLSDIEKSYGVYPGGQSQVMFSSHWDDLFDLWYAFDEETQHYEYHQMYFYSTAAAFQADDTQGTMIERTITFKP